MVYMAYTFSKSEILFVLKACISSLSILFFPLFIVLYEFFAFCSKKTTFFWLFLICFIHVPGKNNFSGEPISLLYLIYLILIKVCGINFILRGNRDKQQKKIIYLAFFVLAYLVFSFLAVYFSDMSLLDTRGVRLFLISEIQNSTNYINVMVALLTILLFSDLKVMFALLSILVFFISFLWQNRTGLILTPFILIFFFLKNKNYILSFVFVSFILVNFPTLVSLSQRLSQIGLDSDRTILFADTLDSILSGQYFFGGYKVDSTFLADETKWAHNLFLDAYRLSGVPGMLFLILVFVFSLVKTIFSRHFHFINLFSWLIATILSFTSVVFESSLLEFLFIGILFFNIYLLKLPCKQVSSISLALK